jgi:hypothetical protein
VIDVSGSMKQSDPNYLSREAALAFVEKLSRTESSRVGLVTFQTRSPVSFPWSAWMIKSSGNPSMKSSVRWNIPEAIRISVPRWKKLSRCCRRKQHPPVPEAFSF